jgi:hypothetical protein
MSEYIKICTAKLNNLGEFLKENAPILLYKYPNYICYLS